MKYVEKYKDLKHMDVTEEHLLYTDKDRVCRRCGSITHFVDIGFEAPFCSEECYEKTVDDYLDCER